MNPLGVEVMVIAAAVAVGTATVNKILVDQKKLADIQKRMKDYQKRYGAAHKSGDKAALDKMEKENHEIMGLTKEMFKMQMKPLWITMIPILFIFWFLGNRYAGTENLATLPVLDWGLSWFWLYFIVVVTTSMVFDFIYKRVKGL